MMSHSDIGMDPWMIQVQDRFRYEQQFNSLRPINGVITGDQAKGYLLQSQLPPLVLGKIWDLSDRDSDGKLDLNEFSIACKLINLKLRGYDIPNRLPDALVESLKLYKGGKVKSPPVVTAVPAIPPVPRPITGPPAVPPMTAVSHQSKQSVANSRHVTSHIPSKPPARPPPFSTGAGFVPITGPPPKPAPPSFPNSPAAVSPVKPIAVPAVPAFQTLVTNAGVPGGAPVAPINTAPMPIAAFNMGQTVPIQPMPGMMPVGTAAMPPVGTIPTGNGMIVAAGIMPSSVVPVAPLNGSIIHTPVSTNTPLSTTARPPSFDRMGSMDSRHSIDSQHSVHTPQTVEWAVPHQTKLKYTQVFNTWDRTRSGFLSGPQAKNIMVQSQLPQLALAQIWMLSDMDSDGRLGCEEFVLAMHLCDMAKAGETIPTTLPLELIPPTFRRQRQSSITSPQGVPDIVDPSAGMPQSSFEDKRKENYEKGQAELDRRRKALLEIQQKEQAERERKEREEAEKQEKIRLEQERRRQAELEKQMLRQKELEMEKEEQRKRAQEQREAARKEMERQRQLEWENQKSQELQSQRQKESEILLKLKAKNQTLSIELGSLNDKVKELSQKICDTRVGVSNVKTTIDGMRSTRDTQLQEMAALKNKLREQNQRLLSVSQEKARIEAKNKINAAQDTAGQEAIKMAFANKQITLKQLKDKIEDLQSQINNKMSDIENNNSQLEDVRSQMRNLLTDCKKMYATFDEKRSQVIEMRGKGTGYSTSAWGDNTWSNNAIAEESAWPTSDTIEEPVAKDTSGTVKYRALYEFVARNQDEISFQPGDIILVPPVQNAEPGWMAGEIRGHTGWFPESYVEPIDVSGEVSSITETFVHQDSVEKRMLEEIAEVPENVSDAGSLGGEGPFVDPITPKLGAGQQCNLSGTALYQYKPTNEQHLSFAKGETITITEQQDEWSYGKSSSGIVGWFPNSYVQVSVTNGKEATATGEGINEYYMTLYQYASNEVGDLNFNDGEVLLVIKKDGDWWTGVIGDRTGIFPSNYVEKYDMPDQSDVLSSNAVVSVPDAQAVTTAAVTRQASEKRQHSISSSTSSATEAVQPSTQPAKTAEQLEEERDEAEDRAELPDFAAMAAQQRSRKPEIVQVIAPYQATSVEQLDLQRGQLIMIRKKTDSGWWEGELQARGKKRQVGWFPASYVKLLTSSSNRSTPVSHGYADSPTDPNAERVMALYPYTAQNDDELSFEKGDVICVIGKDEESWWRGEFNGQTGVFPSNYVSPMFNDFAGEDPLGKLDSMERKRQDYIRELISTEQAYIEDMRLVHEVFEKPLLESMVLKVDEVDKIFVNWRDIIACNDNFLRTLRIRRDNSAGGVVRMIGDVLCENIPRMSAYVRFCSCQISAAVHLQRLTETCPEFVKVGQKCQQDPRTKGMPLSSFLIKPMQRITKYPLIISKILEYTRRDHPDRQYLQEALAKAEEFCTQVNEGVREKENSDRLEWLQTHVACDGLEEQLVFNSLTNSLGPRKLLHYGILRKAKSGKELVAFLTNDFMLFAQPLKSMATSYPFSFERNEHNKFKLYRKPIFLQDLSILGESDGSSYSYVGNTGNDTLEGSRTLRLGDSKKAITLIGPSKNECATWLKRIIEAKKRYKETEKRLQRQRSIRGRPKGHLLLVVVEAEELNVVHTGKCNAFCKVSMGSQEDQTSVVSGSDCPLWDTSMQFQVKDLYEDTLCITVFDKGYFSPDEFLGRAEVRVVDIMRDSKDACGPIQKRIRLHEVDRGDVVLKLDLRLFGNR